MKYFIGTKSCLSQIYSIGYCKTHICHPNQEMKHNQCLWIPPCAFLQMCPAFFPPRAATIFNFVFIPLIFITAFISYVFLSNTMLRFVFGVLYINDIKLSVSFYFSPPTPRLNFIFLRLSLLMYEALVLYFHRCMDRS